MSGLTIFRMCFNPRSRTGSDAPSVLPTRLPAMLQSTLPHGERRGCVLGGQNNSAASIHAPARGATGMVSAVSYSHHASIHAPARGATAGWRDMANALASFNPRSRTGSDGALTALTMPSALLQSTLPHGERPFSCRPPGTSTLLQSTLPHGERRAVRSGTHAPGAASIHAPARGATIGGARELLVGDASIHAPARGATAQQPYYNNASGLQSTLPHGERQRLQSLFSD